MNALLCLAFCASGCASLLFETLWFRQTGLVLGNSVWASSLVTASFMGGLALGSALSARLGRRVQRPVAAYGFLEIGVGVSGLAIVFARHAHPAEHRQQALLDPRDQQD